MNIKLTPDQDTKVEKRKVGRVPVLILRPANRAPAAVGVLWIHGGGLLTGFKEQVFGSRAMDFLRRYGVTVVSPGYRLSWQQPYPAAFHDCFDVLKYMNAHQEELGLRTIMVGGESAGGGLTAAVCMKARDQGIPVAFQMPLYPMLSNLDTESSRNNHGRVWSTRRNHFAWRMYLRENAKNVVSPYAAPAMQTDYRGLPPCYTFVGDGEPFYAETLEYVKNLRAAGVKADVDVYHTNIHAFDSHRPDSRVTKKAIEALNKRFEYALEHYC